MGDAATGLYIGATLQLMSMGVVAVGGSSMPDYPVAAIIATAIACSTGRGMEAGLAIGLPVAMLGVNFDVIYKIFNGFLMHKEMSLIEEGKFKSFLSLVKVSPLFYGLCSALPVFLCVAIGPTVVNAVLDFMPAWFTTGLSVAAQAGYATSIKAIDSTGSCQFVTRDTERILINGLCVNTVTVTSSYDAKTSDDFIICNNTGYITISL